MALLQLVDNYRSLTECFSCVAQLQARCNILSQESVRTNMTKNGVCVDSQYTYRRAKRMREGIVYLEGRTFNIHSKICAVSYQ